MFMQGPGGASTPMSPPVSAHPPMGAPGGPPPPMMAPPPPMMAPPPPMMGAPGGPPPPMMAPPPPMMAPPAAQYAGGTAVVNAPQPPYLASQTAARMGRPVEPFNNSLQTTLIVFGILLTAAFVVPVLTKPDTVFWWDLLGKMEGKEKIVPIFLAAAGLLGIAFGAIPVPTTARAAAAASLGMAPMLYIALAIPKEFQWQLPMSALGSLLVPAGLLLRGAYREASLGRILATIGALCVLIPMLVPEHDKVPLVELFDRLADAKKLEHQLAAVFLILHVALAVVALAVWIPAPSSAGGAALAWIWILLPIVTHFAILIAAGHLGDRVGNAPGRALFGELDPRQIALFPVGIVASGFIAYAGYGLAALLGKNLEH